MKMKTKVDSKMVHDNFLYNKSAYTENRYVRAVTHVKLDCYRCIQIHSDDGSNRIPREHFASDRTKIMHANKKLKMYLLFDYVLMRMSSVM